MGIVYFEGNVEIPANTHAYLFELEAMPMELSETLTVTFNNATYIVSKKILHDAAMYGETNEEGTMLDFSTIPFALIAMTNRWSFHTPNEGNYSLKIESYEESSDSTTSSNLIINYLMASPSNTNWNVLSSMLGDGDWSKLKAYVETTSHNMNQMVLKSFFGGSSE